MSRGWPDICSPAVSTRSACISSTPGTRSPVTTDTGIPASTLSWPLAAARGLHLHAATMLIPLPDGTDLIVSALMPGTWDRLLTRGL